MTTKYKSNDIITALTNNILKHISTKPLYLDLNKADLLNENEEQRDNKLLEETNKRFKDFANETCLSEHVIQLGITFVREERTEKVYFANYLDEQHIEGFKVWLGFYEDNVNVPVKMNELLCDRTKYWKNHSFPKIIVYNDGVPFFIEKDKGEFATTNMIDCYDSIFDKKTNKAFIDKVHKAFIEKETYSRFKIFFTSNFKKSRAQTFIKFKNVFCDINNTQELNSFIKLCFLIDIVLGSVVKDFENLIYHYEYYREILSHGTKAAMTAIMSRNFSHNIGSHVLSTISKGYLLETEECCNKIKEGNGKFSDCKVKVVKSENIPQAMDFFAYLQKRMDLIARLVSGQYTGSEPMYFVGDVLNGFLNQDLLLNHLVQDQRGIKKDKIQFKICLPGNEKPHIFTYRENGEALQDENKVIKRWICDDPVKDFLVSIPDGEIGCQAFYLFLESMMRNSAKYGFSKNVDIFQIAIKLTESTDKNFYKIVIGDNLSLCNSKLVNDMRKKIKNKIIDNSGQLITKDFGIAEMREACRFLIEPFGDEHPAHEEKGEKFPLWVDCPAPQDIHYNRTKDYFCRLDGNCNHLAYTFNLLKPQMVGIIGKDDDKEKSYENKNYGIEKLKLNDLKSRKCAYQFVLVYINDTNKDLIIDELVRNHYLLPFRLILVGNDISLPNNFPKRRVVICNSNAISLNNVHEDENAEKLIISTYEAWIENRWLEKQCANLIIAFDRANTIFEKYKKIKDIEILSGKVNWTVDRAYFDNNKFVNCTKYKRQNVDQSRCKYYIYDNHSCDAKARNLLSNKNLSYLHETGGKNRKIFDTLASPPDQNGFTFKYFLLSLLEAALTRVIIIDERVAESCIDQNEDYNIDQLISLNKSLCYPVFYIENKELNEEVGNKLVKIECADNKKELWKLILNSEVQIKNDRDDTLAEADFIIVHYGIIETHEKLKKVDSLYSLAPSIVITSGRGVGTIRKDDSIISNLPFLEASILKDNTYPSLSKYHLVRALMSIKGNT